MYKIKLFSSNCDGFFFVINGMCDFKIDFHSKQKLHKNINYFTQFLNTKKENQNFRQKKVNVNISIGTNCTSKN